MVLIGKGLLSNMDEKYCGGNNFAKKNVKNILNKKKIKIAIVTYVGASSKNELMCRNSTKTFIRIASKQHNVCILIVFVQT
jgi:hypothetical protein